MPRRDQHDRRTILVHGQPLGNLEPVEIRKLHVEQHHVGAELLDGPQRRGAVAGFADDLEALRAQESSGEGTETVVVVHDED